MKKIIFVLMLVASIVFVSCDAPAEINIGELSTGKTGLDATFKDFFDPVELVHVNSNNISTAIVMDKNTGVLYVRKRSNYQWGMSPIYDSDGTILTQEKWLARRTEKR